MVDRIAVNFGNGKAVAAEVTGKFEEGEIFFANVVKDADGGGAGAAEANDLTAGTAEFALQRDDALREFAEVLVEELF